MKVLLIDVNCKGSSTGKIVYDLFKQLKADGHEAAICYGRGSFIDEPGIYKFGIDCETEIHAGLARVTGLNGYFSPISTKRLINYIDKFKPDVIHIHELHAYFVNIKPLIRYIKMKKIKTIWTFHCEYMYTGKCGHSYECEKWKTKCGKCPSVRDYPKSLLIDRTEKMFTDKKELLTDWDFTVVTPSQWLANRVKQSFLRDKKIFVVHNGIDTENIFYLRDAKDIKNKYALCKKKVILSVAPNIMDDHKGGHIIIELSKMAKDKSWIFVMVGADETRKYSENVLMIERTANQNELAEWYSAADVFLICSKRENFPTTCLEALCCGAPIVGIDEGGTKETAPKPYGIFVGDGETEKILNGIKTHLQSGISKKEISQNGISMYSMQVMYKKYLKLYSELK